MKSYTIGPSQRIHDIYTALSALHYVTHMKLNTDTITFSCTNIERALEVIHEYDNKIMIKEIKGNQQVKYKPSREPKEMIFLFNYLDKEEDAIEIKDRLSKYKAYQSIELDYPNKLIRMKTNDAKALHRVEAIAKKINPNITVELHRINVKRSFKAYLHSYLFIAIFVIGIALGAVSDAEILKTIGWMIALLAISNRLITHMFADFKKKQFHAAIMILALAFGFLSKAYLETIIVSALYQLSEMFFARIVTNNFDYIRENTILPETGLCKVNDEVVEKNLSDFDIGDILVIEKGKSVPISGKAVHDMIINSYLHTSVDEEIEVKAGESVESGSLVCSDDGEIELTEVYEDSTLSTILESASLAPLSRSKLTNIIYKIAKVFRIGIFVTGIITAVVFTVFYSYTEYNYLYLAAIMLTLSETFVYEQAASFATLSGCASAFSKRSLVYESASLDGINDCTTIVYDMDESEVDQEEKIFLHRLKKTYKSVVVFNNGLDVYEEDEYRIYNDITDEQKLEVIDEIKHTGMVLYIGDGNKNIELFEHADISVSRGGFANQKVTENCDIQLLRSSYDVMLDLFKVAKTQRQVNIQNILLGLTFHVLMILLAIGGYLPWFAALFGYALLFMAVLYNTRRIL